MGVDMPHMCHCLQVQLVRELGAVLRNQIPCLRPAILEAYGDILHRAWREASGACALETESTIQVCAAEDPAQMSQHLWRFIIAVCGHGVVVLISVKLTVTW